MWGHMVCQWLDCLRCSSHTPPVSVPPQPRESSPPQLPDSAPPTGLDECLFFISLVSDFLAVRFSVSSGCVRRCSVSTYAAILVLLITSVLNCASDRLAISSLLSCISCGALICSFIWAFFSFLSVYLLHSKGWSLRCSPGRGNAGRCAVTLYVGEGLRGSNGACSTLCWISVTPSATHNQTGPLWC